MKIAVGWCCDDCDGADEEKKGSQGVEELADLVSATWA
jgi:hypothetical protein